MSDPLKRAVYALATQWPRRENEDEDEWTERMDSLVEEVGNQLFSSDAEALVLDEKSPGLLKQMVDWFFK